MLRLGVCLIVTITILQSSSHLVAADRCRPCGPDSMTGPLRLLIPQEFAGADFRPACRRHDACYDTPGMSRAACDRQYLRDMECACNQSKLPRVCRFVARIMSRVTAKRGGKAFRSAQLIAAGRLRSP